MLEQRMAGPVMGTTCCSGGEEIYWKRYTERIHPAVNKGFQAAMMKAHVAAYESRPLPDPTLRCLETPNEKPSKKTRRAQGPAWTKKMELGTMGLN